MLSCMRGKSFGADLTAFPVAQTPSDDVSVGRTVDACCHMASCLLLHDASTEGTGPSSQGLALALKCRHAQVFMLPSQLSRMLLALPWASDAMPEHLPAAPGPDLAAWR